MTDDERIHVVEEDAAERAELRAEDEAELAAEFNEIAERYIREEEADRSVAEVCRESRRVYLAETPEPVGNPNAALHDVRVDVAQVFGSVR